MRSVVLSALLAAAALAGAPAVTAQEDEGQRLQKCYDRIDRDPEGAYQDGLSWLALGNRPAARQCTALALIAMGEEAEGAARLEELANAPDAGGIEERGVYLAQSGNAWLLAGLPAEAIVTLTNAMKLRPSDYELYKDRARAHVLQKNWADAAIDLDMAITMSAGDAEAHRMRGLSRLKLNRLADAWADVEAAMKLAPTDVKVLVLRGDVREAMRLQGIDDPAGLDQALQPRTRIVGN
jgi:tetratricopeptide (TPR) repeat protein